MRIQVDYDFYTDTYMGEEIPEDSFERKSIEAEALINMITFGRIRKYNLSTEDLYLVKMAICASAESYYRADQHKGIKSENNDGYSITYTDSEENAVRTNAIGAADLYLSGTTLQNRMVNYGYEC